jgi:hypothetical protein
MFKSYPEGFKCGLIKDETHWIEFVTRMANLHANDSSKREAWRKRGRLWSFWERRRTENIGGGAERGGKFWDVVRGGRRARGVLPLRESDIANCKRGCEGFCRYRMVVIRAI